MCRGVGKGGACVRADVVDEFGRAQERACEMRGENERSIPF